MWPPTSWDAPSPVTVGMRLEMLPSRESMKVSPYAGVTLAAGEPPSTALSALREQPAAATMSMIIAAIGRRGTPQRTPWPPRYFEAGGGVGGGGPAGAGVVVSAAGAA